MPILGALEPGELIVLIVAAAGLAPLIIRYTDESKWFVVGYGLLFVATLSTNVEELVLADLFNFLENVVGLMGAGVAFAYAAYRRRQSLKRESSRSQRVEGAE